MKCGGEGNEISNWGSNELRKKDKRNEWIKYEGWSKRISGDAYPMGGVRPSPLSSKNLLIIRTSSSWSYSDEEEEEEVEIMEDIIDVLLLLVLNKRAPQEPLAFKITTTTTITTTHNPNFPIY